MEQLIAVKEQARVMGTMVVDIRDHIDTGPWVCDGSTQIRMEMKQFFQEMEKITISTPSSPLNTMSREPTFKKNLGRLWLAYTEIQGDSTCNNSSSTLSEKIAHSTVFHHLSHLSVDIQQSVLIKFKENSGVQMQLT